MPFLNQAGLLALLSLIPFIILYLRKPKPQDRVIPSLMFILQNKKTSTKNSFLRNFLTNLLFFIQLLALIWLSVSVAQPYIKLPYDITLENTIIILDASASMQAEDGGKARFEEAVKEAKSALSGKNSIILAEHIPLVILEDEDQKVASDILGNLKPKATTTNLRDAMLLAKDILGERPGRIVIISDFNNVDVSDLLVVKRTLSSEEVVVNFIGVSNNAENAGIINLDIGKHSIKASVKNFNPVNKQVNLKLVKDGKVISESGKFDVLPNSVEAFVFDDTPPGLSTIELEPKDDLMVDNTVYISAPLKQKVNVLLITNSYNTYLENALLASRDVSLNIVNPPVLTVNTNGDRIEPFKHDVIVVSRINNVGGRDGILPGTFQDLSAYVRNGGRLVITAQDDLMQFNMADLGIVSLSRVVSDTKRVCMDTINELTKEFKNSPCFATVSRYFDAAAGKDTKPIASVESIPILALKDNVKGKVFYYGIFDDASDFKSLPSYPIFWNSLVNFLAETEDIRDFNSKTGKVLTISEQRVKTPSSSLTASKLIFDEAGYYEFDNKKFAANLIDEAESDVTKGSTLEKESESSDILKEASTERDFSISPLILIAVFLLLCFEVFYIKRRGDL